MMRTGEKNGVAHKDGHNRTLQVENTVKQSGGVGVSGVYLGLRRFRGFDDLSRLLNDGIPTSYFDVIRF